MVLLVSSYVEVEPPTCNKALPADKRLDNVDKRNVAMDGHDVTAFFTQNKPVKGSSRFASQQNGVTYFFASAQAKQLFDASPNKYIPKFGGYCAVAASFNKIETVQIDLFDVYEGKLYFNRNAKAQKIWNKNKKEVQVRANGLWPCLVIESGRDIANTSSSIASASAMADGQSYLVNVNDKGVMLDGYDVVALQNQKQVTAGSYAHQASYNSATYNFSSSANKAAFEQNPAKYAPQFGGFCALSASMGKLYPGVIDTWSVEGGKLYVQGNAKAKEIWEEKGPQKLIGQADNKWGGLRETFASGVTHTDVHEGQITLEAAQKMGEVALKYMKDNGAPGGAVAIVDDAGTVVYLVRATGTFSAASEVSIGKARTAALFGFPSKKLEDGIYGGRNSLITAGFNMMRGGLPIMFRGVVVGGIGVSGASSADQDVEISEAALGLR